MLFDDHYLVPANTSTAVFKDRGSVFHGFVFPLNDEAEVKNRLKQVKAEMPDATHHCYAAVLGADKAWKKWSDDGEPSNTAGMPIFRKIQQRNLTNVLVVVVRYFGGTMLGVPGLINAYGTAAELALEQAGKNEIALEENFRLQFGYQLENEVFQWLKRHEARIIKREDAEKAGMIVAVSRAKRDLFLKIHEFSNLYEVEIKPV